jgi:hypothetical protein
MQNKNISIRDFHDYLLTLARRTEGEGQLLDVYKVDFEKFTKMSDMPQLIKEISELAFKQGRVSGQLDILLDLKQKYLDNEAAI